MNIDARALKEFIDQTIQADNELAQISKDTLRKIVNSFGSPSGRRFKELGPSSTAMGRRNEPGETGGCLQNIARSVG